MLDPRLLEPETIRPLRRAEYERLLEAGVFADERVELLRGALVTMTAQGWKHAWVTAQLGLLLSEALRGRRFHVRQHSPLGAGEDSMPEPDVSIARSAVRHAHPTASSLVIEVADSSLTKDRKIKTEIYAEARMPEYWIVDVDAELIEVRTRPRGSAYGSIRIARPGDELHPVRLPDVTIAVTDVFPPRSRRAPRSPRPARRRRS